MSPRRLVLALPLLALACGSSDPQPSKVEQRPSKPIETAPPATTDEPAPTRAIVHGPATEASAAERRDAVLKLLTDGSSAEHLPLDASDPGVDLDRLSR